MFPGLKRSLIHRLAYAVLPAMVCAAPALAAPTRTECMDMAARNSMIPRNILDAVLSVEGGRPGLRKYNANGSYDMGPMQVNSVWLPELGRRGISEYAVTNDFCTNILVGAWILGRELKRANARGNTPEFWQAVGNYNSHTPNYNARYAVRVWRQAKYAQITSDGDEAPPRSAQDASMR